MYWPGSFKSTAEPRVVMVFAVWPAFSDVCHVTNAHRSFYYCKADASHSHARNRLEYLEGMFRESLEVRIRQHAIQRDVGIPCPAHCQLV